MTAPGTWVEDAACQGLPTRMFFPGPGDRKGIARAKAICDRCPVTTQCAEAGRDERDGIWGGMTPRERNRSFRHHGDLVPAVGAARRLRALACLGYGPRHLAAELNDMGVAGLTRHGITWIRDHAIQTESDKVDAIARLYRVLVKRGQNTHPRAATARKQAVREEWASPRDWAGVDIDDPNALPSKGPQPYLFTLDAFHPAFAAQRRLQALACLGYSGAQIAGLLRDRGHYISNGAAALIVNGSVEKTARDRHIAIRDLYDDLHSGPRSTSARAHVTIARAQALGWVPPSAWAGVDIDDPRAAPSRAA